MKKELKLIQSILVAILVVLVIGFWEKIINILNSLIMAILDLPHDVYRFTVAASLMATIIWVGVIVIGIIWNIPFINKGESIISSLKGKVFVTLIFLAWVGAVPLLLHFDIIK